VGGDIASGDNTIEPSGQQQLAVQIVAQAAAAYKAVQFQNGRLPIINHPRHIVGSGQQNHCL
jgi:hypothetical protein